MPKSIELSQAALDYIYKCTDDGEPQDLIAGSLGITRWQVRKALAMRAAHWHAQEEHMLNPADYHLFEVARATGLRAEQLEKLLSFPNVSDRNIFYWLSKLSPDRLLALVKHVVESHPTMKQES